MGHPRSPCSPAPVPMCATHPPPLHSQTQPRAADCLQQVTQLQSSSLSSFLQPKPHVPLSLWYSCRSQQSTLSQLHSHSELALHPHQHPGPAKIPSAKHGQVPHGAHTSKDSCPRTPKIPVFASPALQAAEAASRAAGLMRSAWDSHLVPIEPGGALGREEVQISCSTKEGRGMSVAEQRPWLPPPSTFTGVHRHQIVLAPLPALMGSVPGHVPSSSLG